jgi:D-alanine-D-alanine ligase-like ATP-grasp enzyme
MLSPKQRIKFLIKTYDQPVLVEEFIVGKEVTAILLEGLNKKVYIAEKKFNKPQAKYIFATFEDQWLEGATPAFTYQPYKDPILMEYVKKAFEMLKMADYAKFDIRIDSSGRYYFIDPNSNPAFGPKEVDCAMTNILSLYGISFTAILRRLIVNTLINSS